MNGIHLLLLVTAVNGKVIDSKHLRLARSTEDALQGLEREIDGVPGKKVHDLESGKDEDRLHATITVGTTTLPIKTQSPSSTLTTDKAGHAEQDANARTPAALPTPFSPTINIAPVALYVPPYDPQADPGTYRVDYLGPGNAHSTVYQVVYKANAERKEVTATLVEDASNADLMGAQQQTVLANGQSTNVWAAVSCGFKEGLPSPGDAPAAGYCVHFHNAAGMTYTWTTAIASVTAQTTIVPSPGAVQASLSLAMASKGQGAIKPHNGVRRIDVPCVLLLIVPTALLFFL